MKTDEQLKTRLKKVFEKHSEISLCILFGSMMEGKASFSSDLDIGVAGGRALTARQKQGMIEELAVEFERPIDLIDLQVTYGTILHQILTKGEIVFCRDHQLYAEIIKKMLFNQSDFMPYHHRILKERREKWINR